jgi:hypothetical protein
MAARDAERLVQRLARCERQAKVREMGQKPFDLPACRTKRRARFERALGGRRRCPDCLAGKVAPIGERAEALVARAAGDLFCDLASGRPALGCGTRLLRRLTGASGLAHELTTCRVRDSKAAFRMDPFDEEECIAQARTRFAGGIDLEGCGTCVGPRLDALEEDVVAGVALDNRDAYCACQFGFGTCDDANPCTTDACLRNGDCRYDENRDPCADDGDPCTIDVCSGRACTHLQAQDGASCPDDGDRCTRDVCTAGACTHPARAEGSTCADANACNGAETCRGGTCVPGTPLDCPPDGNVCTDDCIPASGCGFADNSSRCEDGNACTVADVCVAGACGAGRPLNCDDGDGCTVDTCSAVVGCIHTPIVGCP